MNDLRFAFRQLPKNPGFTAVAVLSGPEENPDLWVRLEHMDLRREGFGGLGGASASMSYGYARAHDDGSLFFAERNSIFAAEQILAGKRGQRETPRQPGTTRVGGQAVV